MLLQPVDEISNVDALPLHEYPVTGSLVATIVGQSVGIIIVEMGGGYIQERRWQILVGIGRGYSS